MAVKDRIPLRDHFLQITPGFVQDVHVRLDMILQAAGVNPVPNQRLAATQVGHALQPLMQRLLDHEQDDAEIGALLPAVFALNEGNSGMQWATLDLSAVLWSHRNFDDAFRHEHFEESHALIMGLYEAASGRFNRPASGEYRDRVIVATLANALDLVLYSDYYLPIAANGALSDMACFQPRGHYRVDFDAQYPLVLRMLDVMVRLQQGPFELPVVV